METKPQNPLLTDRWLILVSGIIVAGIFLCYGIRWLVLAYSMTNPHVFLMFFFSASMVILINATLLFVLLVTVFLKLRARRLE
jgi:hypothetical protein